MNQDPVRKKNAVWLLTVFSSCDSVIELTNPALASSVQTGGASDGGVDEGGGCLWD